MTHGLLHRNGMFRILLCALGLVSVVGASSNANADPVPCDMDCIPGEDYCIAPPGMGASCVPDWWGTGRCICNNMQLVPALPPFFVAITAIGLAGAGTIALRRSQRRGS